jgi:hypothetical protein
MPLAGEPPSIFFSCGRTGAEERNRYAIGISARLWVHIVFMHCMRTHCIDATLCDARGWHGAPCPTLIQVKKDRAAAARIRRLRAAGRHI